MGLGAKKNWEFRQIKAYCAFSFSFRFAWFRLVSKISVIEAAQINNMYWCCKVEKLIVTRPFVQIYILNGV